MSDNGGAWVPLSVREQGQAASWHVLHEGVPSHMQSGLNKAVQWMLKQSGAMSDTVQRRLRLAVAQDYDTSVSIILLTDEHPDLLLDVADCLLDLACTNYRLSKQQPPNWQVAEQRQAQAAAAANYVGSLMRVLDEANSAYTVAMPEAPGGWSLVRRVDQTATDALADAAGQAADSAALLASAWAATFQREPDLTRAYRDAVLAVEAAASRILIPNDPTPTLGKAITHLASTTAKWTVAGLDDKSQQSAATLLAMLQTVWQNQGRHVGQGGAAPDSVEQGEAEAVAFLAITLVQWFERGLVQPKV